MTEETRKLAEERANEEYQAARLDLARAQFRCEEAWTVLSNLTRDVMPKEMEVKE
jgi:hypothetical protein